MGQEQSHLSVDWQNPFNKNHLLNRGLIGWWLNAPPLQGGYTHFDLTGKHHGKLTNMDPATDWIHHARPGGFGALDFDGVNDAVTIPDHTDLNPSAITISLWTNLRSLSGYGNFVEKDFNSGYRVRIEPDGKLRFLNNGGSNGLTTTGTIAIDTWVFLAFTADGFGFNAYIDGTLDRSGGAPYIQSAEVNDLHIGSGFQGGAPFELINGQIDDVRLYNRALSADEINEYYWRSKQGYADLFNRVLPAKTFLFATPPTPPTSQSERSNNSARPPAHTPIDASHEIGKHIVQAWGTNSFTGNKVIDISGRGEDGTVTGSPPTINTRYGKAIDFEGTSGDDKIKANNTPITSYPFTLVSRFRADVVATNDALALGNSINNSDFVYIRTNSFTNNLALGIARGSGETISGGSYSVGDIIEVAGVFASTTDRKLYVNGVLENSSTVNVGFPSGLDRSSMGLSSGELDTALFNGPIFWGYWLDAALTAEQVKSLYEDPFQVYAQAPALPPFLLMPPPAAGGLAWPVIGSAVLSSDVFGSMGIRAG